MSCFSGRKAKVYVVSKIKPHDVRVEFFEIKVHCTFRESVKIHLKEIKRKLAIDIMELVVRKFFVRAVFWNLRTIMEEIGAF